MQPIILTNIVGQRKRGKEETERTIPKNTDSSTTAKGYGLAVKKLREQDTVEHARENNEIALEMRNVVRVEADVNAYLFEQAKDRVIDAKSCLEFLKNHSSISQKMKVEIIKIAAAKDAEGVSKNMPRFNILAEKDRCEIAEVAAAQKGWVTSELIKNYGIQDQTALVRIAKIAARDQGAVWFIPNYGIENEKDRIEIAEIVALSFTFGDLAGIIHKYQISDQNLLIKYAKRSAATSGYRTSQWIKNFDIKDMNALKEIATIAVNQSAYSLGFISCYGFTDMSFIAELAKLGAARQGGFTAREIHNTGITDENELTEIGRIAFRSILERSSEDNLGYGQSLGYFLKAWGNNPALKNQCQLATLLQVPFGLEKKENQRRCAELLSIEVAKTHPRFESKVKELFTTVLNTQSEQWCASVAFYLAELPEDDLKMLLKSGLLEEIGSLRYPTMRVDLLILAKKLFKSSTKALFIEKATALKENSKKKYVAAIYSLCYCLLAEQGLDEESLDRMLQYTKLTLYKKDVVKQQQLIGALKIVLEDTSLDAKGKIGLFKYLFPEHAVCGKKKQLQGAESLRQVRAIAGLAGFSSLDVFNETPLEPLVLLCNAFTAKVPFGEIPDLADKFEKYINSSSRISVAAFTYAGVINKLTGLEKIEVLNAYGTFINWFLNGTYKENRYDLSLQSIHLKTIFENRPTLLDKWKEGGEMPLNDLTQSKEEMTELSYSFYDTLFQKIITDRHFDIQECPNLENYLHNPSESVGKSVHELESLLIALASIVIKDEIKEDAEVKIINAASIIDKILSLKSSLPEQFKRDLEDMKKQSRSLLSSSSSQSFCVVDTDDPVDMLLCGTEVSGSCQSVNGVPNLNKCLNAYLIDGKNRMIAVKNENGVIIARSIFRILIGAATKKPTLLLERVYQDGASKQIEKGIIAFAKLRADELGLPLVKAREKEDVGRMHRERITSLGSIAPFEYADSSSGLIRQGDFSVDSDKLVLL